MSKVHGRHTVITVNDQDISSYTNASNLDRAADTHDITCYGVDDKEYQGGLRDATGSMSGIFDNTATTGPGTVLMPLRGTEVTLVRQTEGAGSGLPQESVQIIITKYSQSNPVADMVSWSADFQCTGPIDDTAQATT